MRPPAPVEEADIGSLSQDGRGVARIEGKTVFVDGALAGERVRLRRTRRHRNYDEAVTAEVLLASPQRVAPACAHYGVCGGCRLQHLDPVAQVSVQQDQVGEEFERIGRVVPDRWLPPLTGPSWRYRRRARLGLRYVQKRGRVLCGFRERAAPFLADVRSCEVLADPVGQLVGELGELVGTLTIRDRVPQVEVAVADNATALVFRVLAEPAPADLDALREFGRRRSIEVYLQPGGLDSVTPLTLPATPLVYALPEFGVELEFAPTDFVQVNAVLNQRMVSQAVALLAPEPADRVLDLYCGLGNFSLPLARRCASVTGVEGDRTLVERAAANALRNGIANARFEVANLAEAGATATWHARPHELVLLDPPRAGAWEALPAIAAMRPRRVVYVSCHPASLARDAGALVHEHGFRLAAAGIMDMFPHTGHVETLAVFEAG